MEGAVIASGDDANTYPDGSRTSLGDKDPVKAANEEEYAPSLGDLNHDELGEHTHTAEEEADRADAEAPVSENSLLVRPLVGETASSKLAEGSVPAESGVTVQTKHEALPDKPDEPDA
jgi:hypothetical protein